MYYATRFMEGLFVSCLFVGLTWLMLTIGTSLYELWTGILNSWPL